MEDRELEAEAFIEVLSPKPFELDILYHNRIFTVRQLADADIGIISQCDESTLRQLTKLRTKAIDYISNIPVIRLQRKEAPEIKCFGYMYINDATYDFISAGSAYKSPYILFQEFMESAPEQRSNHPWKALCSTFIEEASVWLKTDSPSDAELYSYLIWRSMATAGKYDLTAGMRAIPFLWNWMAGELHGSAIRLDQVVSGQTNNPYTFDRYANTIAINLTKLCKNGGKLFRVERAAGTKQVNNLHWMATTLAEVDSQTRRTDLWGDYNPGENILATVPHGLLITPDGTIPRDCIHVFERKAVTEVTVHYK